MKIIDATELTKHLSRQAWFGHPDAHRRATLATIASMATESPVPPQGWTRDTMLNALDTNPGSHAEWLNPYENEWQTIRSRSTVCGWHSKVIRFDVRLVKPTPERLPWWTIAGRTMPGCDSGSAPGTPGRVARVRVSDVDGEPQWLAVGDFIWRNLKHRCDWNDDGTVAVLPEAGS